jgi:N6-adenosine-specific RNA methylase IME4
MIFPPLPRRQFGVLLADPPWAFRTWGGSNATPHRTATDHYITVEKTGLAGLPVASISATDAVLFMWIVDSHFDQGLALARAWGFNYKTLAFVWDKGRIGMGLWTRKEAEVCLLFTRGKPKRIDKGVRQIIRAPRREHSRKPDEQYDRIERLVAGPYIELFARQQRPGWTAWGNETSRFTHAAVVADILELVG